MKRLICLLLAMIFVLSFVACSGDDPENGGENNDGIIEIDPNLNIGEDGEINFPIIPVNPE